MTVETETTTMDMTAGQGMDPADPEEGTGVDGQTGQSGWTKYRDGWSDWSVWVEVVWCRGVWVVRQVSLGGQSIGMGGQTGQSG